MSGIRSAVHGVRALWDRFSIHVSNAAQTVEFPRNHILFVRHGEYLLLDDYEDEMNELTERGRFQAKMVGQYLKRENLRFDRIIVSTMLRARQTAAYICSEMGCRYESCEFTDDLREFHIRDLMSGEKRAQLLNAYDLCVEMPRRHQGRNRYVLIVAHLNVIHSLLRMTVAAHKKLPDRPEINHCAICRLKTYNGDRVSLREYNLNSHLGEDLTGRPVRLTAAMARLREQAH